MSAQHSRQASHLTCAECQQRLQDYLDGVLEKPESMRVFLHVRECEACAEELAGIEQLVAGLEALPERDVPADFDAKVLASVPYEQYRAMAGLRRNRVPVFLEEETLPVWVRARGVRATGAAVAGLVLVGRVAGLLPDAALIAAVAGMVPETVVALRSIARRLVMAVAHAREGA